MSKRRSIKDLIDRDFSEGYAEMRELVDFTSSPELIAAMPAKDRALIRMTELISVAMIEGTNEWNDASELDPVAVMLTCWQATGIALACLNVQGFSEANGKVRQEMQAVISSVYQKTVKDCYAREGSGK
jgi:hypothetical protein